MRNWRVSDYVGAGDVSLGGASGIGQYSGNCPAGAHWTEPQASPNTGGTVRYCVDAEGRSTPGPCCGGCPPCAAGFISSGNIGACYCRPAPKKYFFRF